MAALLSRREQDGLSLRRLAEESGIPVGTLAWWSWRLRQDCEGGSGVEAGGGFVELVEQCPHPSAAVVVVMPSGVRVEVAAGFDVELLRSVVQALQTC
jgi:hypothetical protein